MNNLNYDGVEYGTLDQAILQEYVDINSITQQLREEARNDFIQIEQQETKTYSQSLVEESHDFDFRDKDNVLLNFSGK